MIWAKGREYWGNAHLPSPRLYEEPRTISSSVLVGLSHACALAMHKSRHALIFDRVPRRTLLYFML